MENLWGIRLGGQLVIWTSPWLMAPGTPQDHGGSHAVCGSAAALPWRDQHSILPTVWRAYARASQPRARAGSDSELLVGGSVVSQVSGLILEGGHTQKTCVERVLIGMWEQELDFMTFRSPSHP